MKSSLSVLPASLLPLFKMWEKVLPLSIQKAMQSGKNSDWKGKTALPSLLPRNWERCGSSQDKKPENTCVFYSKAGGYDLMFCKPSYSKYLAYISDIRRICWGLLLPPKHCLTEIRKVRTRQVFGSRFHSWATNESVFDESLPHLIFHKEQYVKTFVTNF